MEPQSGIKTWQWVVTVIVIIVLIVVGVMVFGGKDTETPIDNTDETPAVVDDATAVNRIVMSDQYPGNVVYLSSVQVATSSWVVVQADNNGVPGKVLGSTRFEAGINPGKVTLSEPMVDGKTYYASLYTVVGSTFDITKSAPIKDSANRSIMKVFRASSTVGADIKG